MGLAGRAWGLTVDRVAAYDVVTPDGARRRVDATTDPDLFWALRGGGGSFAIVTAVHLRVRERRSAAWFFASYPAAARAEVLATWDDLAPGAPDALTSLCTLTADRATAFGQYLGSERSLRRLVAPLARDPRRPLQRRDARRSSTLQRRWAGCSEGDSTAACVAVPRASFDAASIYVAKPLSARRADRVRRAPPTPAPRSCATPTAGGSRASRPARPRSCTATCASASRSSPTRRSRPRTARVRRARARIAPFGNGQAYQNYADLDLRDPLGAYYGANLARLRAVKAAIDPANRMRPAQGMRG